MVPSRTSQKPIVWARKGLAAGGAAGDLLTAVLADWCERPQISFESLVHQVVSIIIGGSDTTREAFAMLVGLLLSRPGAWRALMSDPTLIHGAVTEGVRYEPSIGTIARLAVEPIDIAGVWLPAGNVLHLSTLSAMRDPALYADPDCFDLRRTDHPRLHMAFGLGPHRCIGEMLARIQMEESLAALLDVAPDIALEGAPQMVGFGGIRQITPMPVRIP